MNNIERIKKVRELEEQKAKIVKELDIIKKVFKKKKIIVHI